MELKKLSDANRSITNIVKGSIKELCSAFVECTELVIKESAIKCSIASAKNYIENDSVCLFKIDEYEHSEIGPICIGYQFYIWSRKLNVWISFTHTFDEIAALIETEEDDGLAELDGLWAIPTPFDEAKASVDALSLACMSGFGALRNRDQRADFSKKLLKDRSEDNTPEYRKHIAAIAETYFDFGIIPIESKRLIAEGKTTKEIAAMYGITKSKVERALTIDPIDYVEENYKK